jgi:ribosomal protein S18 acetylase RimI-like enzyme
MIEKLKQELLVPVAKFLNEYNSKKEHNVFHLENDYSALINQLQNLDENNSFVLVDKNNIVGFISGEKDKNKGTIQLIGPIIDDIYWARKNDKLFAAFMKAIDKEDFKKLKIKFYKENKKLKKFCSSNKFKMKISQKNIFLDKENFNDLEENDFEYVKEYHPSNNESFNDVDFGKSDKIFYYKKDDEIIAHISYQKKDKNAYIENFEVEGDFRNRNIRKNLLIYTIKNLFNETDTTRIYLTANAKNLISQNLYQKIGFEDSETILSYYKKLN